MIRKKVQRQWALCVSADRGVMMCQRDPHLLLGHLPEARQVTSWVRGSVQVLWDDHWHIMLYKARQETDVECGQCQKPEDEVMPNRPSEESENSGLKFYFKGKWKGIKNTSHMCLVCFDARSLAI